MTNAEIRVISNVKLGEGFFPRFADVETVTYLGSEGACYVDMPAEETALRVDNEDLNLNLYRNGNRQVLKPHGDVNYIWVSLSPNGKMILFNTMHGTAICDLDGNELVNLGNINAPVWYGNDYVVGMNDLHDGYRITSSEIVIASADGNQHKVLTDAAEKGYYPDVDAKYGRIVYNTEMGEIRMLQLNLTEEPILQSAPRLVKKLDGKLLNDMQRKAKRAKSNDAADYRIYINPGHGGYDSDDRLMYLYPIFVDGNKVNEAAGYTREMSFWESVSNLDKGMRLDTLLRELGFQTKMSRVTNTTADDRSLSGIVTEANNWNSDFMLSIHSNAGAPSNYILQLYSGLTPGDNRTYSHMPVHSEDSRKITTLMGDNQYMNEISCWSRVPYIAGDKTFAKDIMGWSNGYGVLRWLNVPGTISEGMMHDYLPETYRLMNIDYKRQESFYFAKTFYEYFCGKELPYNGIGGKIYDVYQKQTFPNYNARKNTRDVFRPINRGVVELWKDGAKISSYTTDTLYNGCFFFWDLEPGTYVVKAVPEGYYPMSDTVEVKNNAIAYANIALSMMRQTPPEVTDYSPKVELTDSVQVSTEVTISFNWDMEEVATAAALTISPAVEGTITFEDDSHTMRFTPATRFEPGVEYTITIGTGACHPDTTFENHLQEPFSFKFRTVNRGSVRLLQTYPKSGEVNVPLNPSFIAIFDAKIVQGSVRKNVAVIDGAGNKLSVNTRSYIYNAAPDPYGHAGFELTNALEPNTEYQLVLYPSIEDAEGVLLNETIYISFTTGEEKVPAIPLVHEMETLFFVGDKENSTDVEAVNTMAYKNKKYAGTYSNQLTYTFTNKGGDARFKTNDPALIMGNSLSKLGMYVFADYSYNTLYAHFGVAGDNQYVKICDLDYAGWLYQEVDLSTLPEGVDYQFLGLRLVGADNLLSGSGSFYVDNIHAEHVELQTSVEQIEVPENAKRKFIENGYLHILLNGVKYNAEGKTIDN